ncbi:MAG: hypothetical protein GEU28_04985 [Dehalococcoidia bacterium]|nr:hypothetical protein [Dehalococcoidia bacterium]
MSTPRGNRRDEGVREKQRPASQRSPAEWFTLALSGLIVGTILALLLFQLFDGGREAILAAEVDLQGVREEEGSFYLPIVVRNSGSGPAERVKVEVIDESNGEPLAEIEFEDVAGESRLEAFAVLDREPTSGVRAVVTSFEQP